jgi:excisionase family DNA binding protein
MDELLTVEEVSVRAGVQKETVRRWIRSGQLPAKKMSKKQGYRIREEDLVAFLEERPRPPAGQVEARAVLRALAEVWEASGDDRYCDIAYQVADMAELLPRYREQWSKWDGNLADPDVDGRALEKRQRIMKWLSNLHNHSGETKKLDQELRRLEGQLILQKAIWEGVR